MQALSWLHKLINNYIGKHMTMQPQELLAIHVAGLYIEDTSVSLNRINHTHIEVLMLEEKPLEWWGTPQDFREWVGRVADEIFEYNCAVGEG